MNAATEYAAATSVAVDRSKVELERLLRKAGATQYGTVNDDRNGRAVVAFRLNDRSIRMSIPLPKRADYALDHRRRPLPPGKVDQRWEQACRARWRGLVLIVKAKLQLIAFELSTIEREFLADVTLPDGRTVHDVLGPALAYAYRNGRLPDANMFLLPAHEGETDQ